jgi:ribosomal protein S18 acetylase RimI-like enzyme
MTSVIGEIRVLSAVEWPVLRDARLQALSESPEAFLADHDQEVSWGEEAWKHTLDTSRWMVALSCGMAVGLLRSVQEPGRPTERHVESIWVAPGHRQRGVLRSLLQVLLADQEWMVGVEELKLWVLQTNRDARLVYTRLGFRPTGKRQLLSDGTGRVECQLSLAI